MKNARDTVPVFLAADDERTVFRFPLHRPSGLEVIPPLDLALFLQLADAEAANDAGAAGEVAGDTGGAELAGLGLDFGLDLDLGLELDVGPLSLAGRVPSEELQPDSKSPGGDEHALGHQPLPGFGHDVEPAPGKDDGGPGPDGEPPGAG